MPEYLTHSRFHTKEEAEEFAALLQTNNIPNEVEQQVFMLAPIYIGERPDPEYMVKILPDDFERVNELQRKEAAKQLDDVNPEYYLFEFTEEELKNVLAHPDEWNYFDQLLAAKLLQERFSAGETIPVEAPPVKMIEPSRIGTLALVAGYVCCILMPLYSIPMGAVVLTSRRTLGNGVKVPLYDKWSQNHAGFIVGFGILGVYFYFRLFSGI